MESAWKEFSSSTTFTAYYWGGGGGGGSWIDSVHQVEAIPSPGSLGGSPQPMFGRSLRNVDLTVMRDVVFPLFGHLFSVLNT